MALLSCLEQEMREPGEVCREVAVERGMTEQAVSGELQEGAVAQGEMCRSHGGRNRTVSSQTGLVTVTRVSHSPMCSVDMSEVRPGNQASKVKSRPVQ